MPDILRGQGMQRYHLREAVAWRGAVDLRHHSSSRADRDSALAEVEMIRRLGVKIETGVELGANLAWPRSATSSMRSFLSVGLGSTPSLGIPGEEHIVDGLAYIEQSKFDAGTMKIGRDVVVIGAGNTAVDCATIARRLGAERVTMVYRRTDREMTAYPS